jgi:uncharacterized protein (DUF1330 family)
MEWEGTDMPAYFVADAFVKNAQALEIFRAHAAPAVARYGGRYLARSASAETVEGNWTPSAVLIIEFPDLERAKTWYRSAEYALALAVLDNALSRNLILVDGMA